jgi:hypothetical protein
MALTDRLKELRKKAEDTAVEHKDQIHEAVQKAGTAADQRTRGKYHDRIEKAGAKVETFVDRLDETDGKTEEKKAGDGTSTPPAS